MTNQEDWFQEESERFAKIKDTIDAETRGENNDTVRKNIIQFSNIPE